MPEAIPVVTEFLGADVVMDAALASDIGGGVAAGAVGSGAAAAGAAAAGGLGSIGTAVASAAAGQVVGSLLAPRGPKAPNVPAPVTMPDPLAQQAAARQSLVEQLARRGRASTILTDPAGGSGKLGG